MKRQGGFTLIELVVVIVILGILAVTAAPRFLNLQDDARNSTLKGLQGAIQGALGITYGKAAIAGLEKSASSAENKITVDGGDVFLAFGYPTLVEANFTTLVQGIGAANSIADFQVIKTIPDQNPTAITFGIPNYTTQCVKYTAATSSAAATVVIEESVDNCTPTP